MSVRLKSKRGLMRSCIDCWEVYDHIPEYPEWITLSALVYLVGWKIPPESAMRKYLHHGGRVSAQSNADEGIAVQRGRRRLVGEVVTRRVRLGLKSLRVLKRNCNGDIEYSKERIPHASKEKTNGNGNSNVPSTKRHRQAAGNRTRRIHQVVKHQPRARPAGG